MGPASFLTRPAKKLPKTEVILAGIGTTPLRAETALHMTKINLARAGASLVGTETILVRMAITLIGTGVILVGTEATLIRTMPILARVRTVLIRTGAILARTATTPTGMEQPELGLKQSLQGLE